MNSNLITKENCKLIIKKCYGVEKCDVLSWMHEPLQENVGIMGTHYKLEITAKVNGDVIKKKCFAKKMESIIPVQTRMIKEQHAYEKEYFVYKTLLKNFAELSADCYLTLDKELLILEDLHDANYKMQRNEKFELTIEEAECVLKTLSNFHAVSIIYENNQGNGYKLSDEYSEYFIEPLYRRDPEYTGNKLLKTSREALLALIDLTTFDNSAEIKQKSVKYIEKFYDMVQESTQYRNVCCHGDLWPANFMFKYIDNVPVDCKLIDFQALRYTLPAHDVCCLLRSVFRIEQLQKYEVQLKHFYYDSLKQFLETYDIDIADHITYVEFQASYDYILPFVVIQNTMFTMMSLMNFRSDIFSNAELFTEFMYDNKKKYVIDAYKNIADFKILMDDAILEIDTLT